MGLYAVKRLILAAAALCLIATGANSYWQSRLQVSVGAPSAYQGPGDIVGSATAWGSCARVYTAAQASTATSLCDLVDSAAPTTVICTLRGSSTGFVDLTGTYCTGSVTPATKCAAATGAVCNISKVYDQAGATGGWLQATAASQPTLTFSAINSLPGMTFVAVSNHSLATAGSVTLSQPFSVMGVYKRTSGTSVMTIVGATSNALVLGNGVGANTTILADPSNTSVSGPTSPDNAFHAYSGAINTAGGALTINVDGSEAAGTAGSGGITTALRIGRGNANFTPNGIIMEAGFWPVAFTSGNRTSLNSNMHGSSGYNF